MNDEVLKIRAVEYGISGTEGLRLSGVEMKEVVEGKNLERSSVSHFRPEVAVPPPQLRRK